MLHQVVRELTVKEKRALRLSIARFEKLRRRVLLRSLLTGLAVSAVLCVLTLVASEAPTRLIIAFWLTIALLLGLWTGIADLRKANREIRSFASALRHNRAEVTRISSSVMAEFEEVEDEGACFAFELPDERLIFVCGQDFYPSSHFPNSDFSLIHVLKRVRRTR